MPEQKYAYKSICAHWMAKIESSSGGRFPGAGGGEGAVGLGIWSPGVLNSNLNLIPNLSTALHFVVHGKHCDGVCDVMCGISYIVYMGLGVGLGLGPASSPPVPPHGCCPNQLSKCPNFICYAHHKNWSKSFCQSHFDFKCRLLLIEWRAVGGGRWMFGGF